MSDNMDAPGSVVKDDILLTPRRVRGRARASGARGPLGQRLFHWGELPDYLKDNEFIKTGYRANTGFRGSLRSLFSLHNESGNVWTHLLGAHTRRACCQPMGTMQPVFGTCG
jgi:hypothetical protein